MTEREKERKRLIELLRETFEYTRGVCIDFDEAVEINADHLLSNGVIVPPCKVGDTVYEVQLYRERIQAYKVVTIKYNGHFWYMVWMLKDGKGVYGNLDGFVDSQLGKTVFLTKEEAEAELRKRGEASAKNA
jgi:hypothetical protein